MCKFIVNVFTPYGTENIRCGDDYNAAIAKYKEIKEFYTNVPCTIKFYNQDDVQFVKTPEKDFERLYNNMVDSVIALGKYQIELSKAEEKLHKERNILYHNLEETDLSKLSDEEQIKYLTNMKSSLTKRRINESENQKNYAFSECFNKIYESLCEYDGYKRDKEDQGTHRYKKNYYTEDMSKKKNRVKKLHTIKR